MPNKAPNLCFANPTGTPYTLTSEMAEVEVRAAETDNLTQKPLLNDASNGMFAFQSVGRVHDILPFAARVLPPEPIVPSVIVRGVHASPFQYSEESTAAA